jgi:hypothetical protein
MTHEKGVPRRASRIARTVWRHIRATLWRYAAATFATVLASREVKRIATLRLQYQWPGPGMPHAKEEASTAWRAPGIQSDPYFDQGTLRRLSMT